MRVARLAIVATCALAVSVLFVSPGPVVAAPAFALPAGNAHLPAPALAPASRTVASAAPPPNGSVGSLQFSLYNPGSNATGPYDQPVGVNSSLYSGIINSNWTNGLPAYTANGTPVYGWIESGASNASVDTLLWLRLNSIPAHGWSNVSVWFWPKSSFNLSKDGFMGEAPELSSPYGAFDNGWRVFDAYSNFSGSTLPTGWNALGSWAGSVHDGLVVASSLDMGAIELPLATVQSSNVTVDASVQSNSSGAPLCLLLAATPGFSASGQFFPSAYALEPGSGGTTRASLETSNSSGTAREIVPAATAPVDFRTTYHVVGLSWRHANSTETGTVNYVPIISQVNSAISPIADVGLGTYCTSGCSSWTVDWVRARNVPTPIPEVSDQGFSPIGVAVGSMPVATDIDHVVAFACNVSATGLTSPSYSWTFGDGTGGLGRTTVHAYSQPGDFAATCTVTGRSGVAGSSSSPVLVAADPAVLLFQAVPSTFALGSSLTLVTNVTGGTPPYAYSYLGLPSGCPGNDSPAISCLPGVAGSFGIEVVVVDSVGEQASAWVTVSVLAGPTGPTGSTFPPEEGYVLGGAVAGAIVLAGVLPVLLWNRRRLPPSPARTAESYDPGSEDERLPGPPTE